MNWLKRLLAPTFFPGSGRHAATETATPTDPAPTPEDLFLDPYGPTWDHEPHRTPYVAGERFRDYYLNEAGAARAADQEAVAGWTRPLVKPQARLQAWKGHVR